jgi:Cu(I)/Ag(I) efflux system membrane fusion protein
MSEKANAKTKLFVILGVLILIIAGFGYFGMKPAEAVYQPQFSATAPIITNGDTVTLSERSRQLAGIQTAKAVTREFRKDIKTTGKITMNENARAYITSRVEGRLERLFVNAEGEYIYPGQIIGEVYSPAYMAAQEEYLQMLDNADKSQNASQGARLMEAARRKLQLLSVTDNDIRRLESERKSKAYMPVYAQFGGIILERQALPGGYIRPGDKLYSLVDLSKVWINTDVYEKDIANVRVNQEAVISSQAYPGETFTGRVVFVSPVLDDLTRTLKVRVELENREGKLKPNMFVRVAIRVPLGKSLIIPESAILESADGQMVFWAQSEDTFVKHAVTAGQYANGYVQILSGLEPDDIVVSAAAFLIDSQTKLGTFSSHDHGGGGHSAESGGHTESGAHADSAAHTDSGHSSSH